MKVNKIFRGFSWEKMHLSCDRCDFRASFVPQPRMGRGGSLDCPCGAKFGIVIERRRYERKKPSTYIVGVINDGVIDHDIRIEDMSVKGLGIKLMRGQTNLVVNDDARIVFSTGDQTRGVIKDIIKVVAIRDGFIGGLMDENSVSQNAIFIFLGN